MKFLQRLSIILIYNHSFGNQTVTKEWFREYNKLSFRSLGTRYNPKFNVVTGTDEKSNCLQKIKVLLIKSIVKIGIN